MEEEKKIVEQALNEKQRKESLELELCSLRAEIAQLLIENRSMKSTMKSTHDFYFTQYVSLNNKIKSKYYLITRFLKLIFGVKIDE